MTKLILACGLALSLSLVACASTSKPDASAATATPAAASSASTAQASTKPKLVCEETKPLGSNLPQRICMTPEEAAQRQKAAQDKMRNLQNQSSIQTMGSSSGG